jgi:hypothetical protein
MQLALRRHSVAKTYKMTRRFLDYLRTAAQGVEQVRDTYVVLVAFYYLMLLDT